MAVDYHVSEEYAYGMYNSCKDVQMPSTNAKALDIICGKPAADCSVKDWLNFMGSTSNGQTPFTINYHINNASTAAIRPMNYSTTPCDKKYGNMSACSCQDCQTTCAPLPPPPMLPKPCTIQGIDCWYFAMLISFTAFCVLFLISVIISFWRNRDKPTSADVKQSGENYDVCIMGKETKETNYVTFQGKTGGKGCKKLGFWIENTLEKNFHRWGKFCANNPVKIIFAGLVLGAILSVGILRFEVTTSPVKLWSAEKSRARQEKNYFDSHFGLD